MANVDIKWHGKELLAKITGVSESGLWDAAGELLNVAKPKAPKRTGALRDSAWRATHKRTTWNSSRKQPKVPEGNAAVGFAIFYAHMVENGTSKMAAKPFLRPALDQAKRRAGVKAVLMMRGKLE